MKSASAWAPGNISCIFVIKRTNSPRTSGSLGLGFTISEGVTVTITAFSTKAKKNNQTKKENKKKESIVYFNNKPIDFPTALSVVESLTKEPVVVHIRTKLPLGSGFGVSGASALATAYALNKFFRIKKSKKELAMIAHIAEVENLTGLGDVTNQYLGGFLAKYESSCRFRAIRFPFDGRIIYYRVFSSLKTTSIIGNKQKKDQINKIGIQKLRKLKKIDQSFEEVIDLSYEFAFESKLLADSKVKSTIESIRRNGGHASMIMLGNSVFSDAPFPGCKKALISNKAAYVV